tara:strand:- start:5226 stop:5633 length:408 start_codon:yes stop_codon:yes gene_type:complete
MVSPVPDRNTDAYKNLLDARKRKIRDEVSRLSDPKKRLERTSITDQQSEEAMKDKMISDIGIEDLLTGTALQQDVDKWSEWKASFESAPLNQDGTRERPKLPDLGNFGEASLQDRLDPPPSAGGAQGRSEENPHA